MNLQQLESFELPKYSGKIKDITKLDAEFFGLPEEEANLIDPQLRLLHEVIYECILDAGKFD